VLDKVLLEKDDFGQNNSGNNEKVLLEYVSANPTGDLHVGHARNGAVADSIVRIMKKSSYAVTREYYEAILESTEEYGPYYILMPGMAMPHAKAGVGVNRDSFSLITLDEPVAFSDGKEVSVLVTLAATSADIHTSVAI
ncbi:arginine--tRNA ligase, partial [Streptococcus danieliae]|nr:arginine--tRNA ligase [Streptococcus danieliae]